MESLRFEVEPFGIRTTIVEPDFFRTTLLEKESTTYAELSIDDYSEEYGCEYRLVSGTCSILQFAAAAIPSSCRLFQPVAVRCRRSGKTFNPKVVGSIDRTRQPCRGIRR
jgi:NAD(P)-dependent dehydrogenase (short-subunit alcohol dehydrogenase family)